MSPALVLHAANKDEAIAALNRNLSAALASITPLQAAVGQLEANAAVLSRNLSRSVTVVEEIVTRLPTPGVWEAYGLDIRGDQAGMALQAGLYDGLTRLTHSSQDLVINACRPLTSISGMNNVEYIGGTLIVEYTEYLTSISGFRRLPWLRWLKIQSNEALASITGFTNVSGVSILQIYSNDNLGSIAGLSSLRQVWQRMEIYSNSRQFDYSGLSGLECIGPEIDCPNCPSWLTNLPTCDTFCSENPGNARCQHCASLTPNDPGEYCG